MELSSLGCTAIEGRSINNLELFSLKVEALGYSEALICVYYSARSQIPEDGNRCDF